MLARVQAGEAVEAAQAGGDLLCPAQGGFFGEVGIGDQRAGHGDDIRPALGQDLLRQLRRVDGADGHHRRFYARRLHRGGIFHVHAVGQEHGGMGAHGLGLLRVEAGGNMDEIHLPVDHPRKFHGLFDLQAALDLLAAGHAVFDEELVAHPLTDPVDDHDGELRPVFQAAAVCVGTLVVVRGEELIEQPAVAAVDEAHIVACAL